MAGAWTAVGQCKVQVGRRRFAALAEIITDPVEQRRILTLWAEQSMRTAPPAAVRNMLRRVGFDYDASIRADKAHPNAGRNCDPVLRNR